LPDAAAHSRRENFKLKLLTITAVGALTISFLLAGLALSGENSLAHRNCVQIETLKGTVRVQLSRSLRTLPTLAYYKAHPVELAAQIAATRQSLGEFAELHC
jgi:hypothetical protein